MSNNQVSADRTPLRMAKAFRASVLHEGNSEIIQQKALEAEASGTIPNSHKKDLDSHCHPNDFGETEMSPMRPPHTHLC